MITFHKNEVKCIKNTLKYVLSTLENLTDNLERVCDATVKKIIKTNWNTLFK